MKNYPGLSGEEEEIYWLERDPRLAARDLRRKLDKNSIYQNTKLNEDIFERIYFTQIIRPILYEAAAQTAAAAERISRGQLLYYIYPRSFYRIKRDTLSAFGTYLDEAQVSHFSNAVAKMFSLSGNFNDSPKLMSWILLEAFFTHHKNGETLVLDREKVLVLRDLLTAYLGCFTQFNQSKNSKKSTHLANPIKIERSLWDYKGLWVLGALLLLILFGGFLYKWFSFFMAGVVNFRAFGLWRESRDFLTLLSYTESKERGGTFTLSKLLNFSLKRQLTERNLTLPSLTNTFIEYIKKVAELFNKKRNLREVMLVFGQFEKATPQGICALLLQKRVQELIDEVGNIRITGEKSMTLYGMLKEIKLLLTNIDDITTGKVEEIINLIEKSLDVIDPKKFYLSVSISSDEKDKSNYDAIKEDVTDYIELLISA
jgi:hypothetical protein